MLLIEPLLNVTSRGQRGEDRINGSGCLFRKPRTVKKGCFLTGRVTDRIYTGHVFKVDVHQILGTWAGPHCCILLWMDRSKTRKREIHVARRSRSEFAHTLAPSRLTERMVPIGKQDRTVGDVSFVSWCVVVCRVVRAGSFVSCCG